MQADGRSLKTAPTPGRAGDYVSLRADMDCVVAFSACPQDIVPIQGGAANIPCDAHYGVIEDSFPAIPPSQPWVP